ncbi:MAG TPA: alkaline phosphatase family protein, partial [Thermoanaerobaculia bacterium]|nr:alkaline phosphatase family protein [Thermoanaerobaculia bacterium]
KPAFLAVHFTELDTAEHDHGPRSTEALAALEKIDGFIGEILAAVRAGGIEGETTVAVVSDHGFLPVAKEVRPGSLFAALGLLDVDAEGTLTAWRAFPWFAGGSTAIYLHPDAPAGTAQIVDKAIDLLASRPERPVRKVYRGEELARLGGFPGAYAVLDAESGFFFSSRLAGPVILDATLRGVHGHTPDREGLAASLLIRGPKIRAGQRIGKVDIRDVAPTLARVLGVDLGPVEGRVLEEIFQ